MNKESNFRPTVLIVDDEQISVKLLTKILADRYEIGVANSGEEALELISNGLKPNLILLDIMMPGISGFETCEKLKANISTSDIPVIFITGLDDKHHEEKGLKLGAVDYIYKPITPGIVHARVRLHLELQQHREFLENILQRRTKDLENAYEDGRHMRELIQEWKA
jgi:putative two-component system response regulator